jgi:hypothetical protein
MAKIDTGVDPQTRAANPKAGIDTGSRRHSGELCMKAVAGMGEFRCPKRGTS